MKYFDPNDYIALKAGGSIKWSGEAELHLSADSPVTITQNGEQYVVPGSGLARKFAIPGEYTLKVAAAASLKKAPHTATHANGEPLTNAEKRPMFSAAEQLVREALQRLKVENHKARKEAASRFNEMQRKRVKAGLQKTAPEPKEGERDYVPPPPPPPEGEPPLEPQA